MTAFAKQFSVVHHLIFLSCLLIFRVEAQEVCEQFEKVQTQDS